MIHNNQMRAQQIKFESCSSAKTPLSRTAIAVVSERAANMGAPVCSRTIISLIDTQAHKGAANICVVLRNEEMPVSQRQDKACSNKLQGRMERRRTNRSSAVASGPGTRLRLAACQVANLQFDLFLRSRWPAATNERAAGRRSRRARAFGEDRLAPRSRED